MMSQKWRNSITRSQIINMADLQWLTSPWRKESVMDSKIIFHQYELSVCVLNPIISVVFQERGKESSKDGTVEKLTGGETHGNDFSAAEEDELNQLRKLKDLKENAFYAYHKDTQDIEASSSTAKTPKMYTPLGPVGLKYLTSSVMPKINANDHDPFEDILEEHKKNKDLVKEYTKNISNQKLEDIIKKFRENEDFLKEYRKNISDFSFI